MILKRLGDGDYPAFDWGEANALFFLGKFTLINQAQDRGLKFFNNLKIDPSTPSMRNSILISYGCVFKTVK